MKILLLGGYGNVGVFLCELILERTDLSIIIAGRNEHKAISYKKVLCEKYNENRIETLKVDASDLNSLVIAFSRADIIINSASTIENTDKIVEALLQTKKDYFDVLISSPQKLNSLKASKDKFFSNGQCVITDGGFHPGIPAALVHFASHRFDEMHSANIGSLLNMDWKFELSSPSTIKEFVSEFKDYDPSAYIKGEWKKLSYKDYKRFDFGKPFGKKACVAMMMEEMKELPEKYPSIKETGFYVSGFNWFADYFVTPLMMLAVNILPAEKLNHITNLFKWSITRFSKPPYKIILQLIVKGKKDNINRELKLEVSHEDGYYLTAASLFACLLQYLTGSIKKPGLFFQANVVEPKKFISDLENLNCRIDKSVQIEAY